MLRNEASHRFHDHDFLARMAVFARAAGVSTEAVALFIHGGRAAELAGTIAARLSPLLNGRPDGELTALMQDAAAYQPPASLEEVRTALYRALARCRKTAQDDEPPSPFIPGEEDMMMILKRLVNLTTSLSYPPRIIARLLHAGRFPELVEVLSMDNRLRTSAWNVQELNALSAAAADFALPEKFVREPELLVERVERLAGR